MGTKRRTIKTNWTATTTTTTTAVRTENRHRMTSSRRWRAKHCFANTRRQKNENKTFLIKIFKVIKYLNSNEIQIIFIRCCGHRRRSNVFFSPLSHTFPQNRIVQFGYANVKIYEICSHSNDFKLEKQMWEICTQSSLDTQIHEVKKGAKEAITQNLITFISGVCSHQLMWCVCFFLSLCWIACVKNSMRISMSWTDLYLCVRCLLQMEFHD